MKITEGTYTIDLSREELGAITFVLTEVSKDVRKYKAVLPSEDESFRAQLYDIVDTLSQAYHS